MGERTTQETSEYKQQITKFKEQLKNWRKLDVQYESVGVETYVASDAEPLKLMLGHPDFPIEESTELPNQRFELDQIKTGETTIRLKSMLRMQKRRANANDVFYGTVERIFRPRDGVVCESECILVRRFTWRPER